MAAGQTCITYGEMKLLNCLTREFRQEAVYDDSGTDLLYFKFTVRVVGHLMGRNFAAGSPPTYFSPSTWAYPTPGDGSAAHHHSSLRYLFAPRKRFEMKLGASFDQGGNVVGGVTILSANPIENADQAFQIGERDVNNGPKVRIIDVTHVTGDTLLRVEAEFEICKVECDANAGCSNASGVLNNRWSCTDDIDKNFMTTRTFAGRLRTTSSRINANSFRNYVVPPLQPGMLRDSMQFAVSEDGLILAYTITDREVAFSPPYPATTWRFSHTESIEREGELGFYSEVSITLGGDRNVDKKLLVSIAAAIAEAKVLTQANPKACFLQSLSITDEYTDNSSLVHLHAKGKRVEQQAAVFGVAAARLGKPIEAANLAGLVANYDRNFSRGARQGEKLEVDGPVSLVGAFAAYLQSPCSTQHKISESQVSQDSPQPSGGPTTTIDAATFTEIPDDGSLASYSESHMKAMYTHYTMESLYHEHGMTVACPIAAPLPTSFESEGGTVTIYPEKTTAFVHLAAPQLRRTIRIEAERVGEYPETLNPAPSFTDDNGVAYRLLDKRTLESTPDRTADDKRLFRSRSEFVYGAEKPSSYGSKVRIGVNPWEKDGLYGRIFKHIPETSAATR